MMNEIITTFLRKILRVRESAAAVLNVFAQNIFSSLNVQMGNMFKKKKKFSERPFSTVQHISVWKQKKNIYNQIHVGN